MQFVIGFVEWSRKKRTQLLGPLGKFLVRLKIKALYLTILTFIFALISVYFLFENHLYFVIFGIIHLIFDGLDGVVARASRPTRLGAHLDNLADRSMVVLLLIVTYFRLERDYFILIVLALYILQHLIHAWSDLKGSVIYCRTLTVIIYFFGFLDNRIFILAYFLVGIFSVYGLAQQFSSWMKKFTT